MADFNFTIASESVVTVDLIVYEEGEGADGAIEAAILAVERLKDLGTAGGGLSSLLRWTLEMIPAVPTVAGE